jgi:hypothetical protein
MDESQTDAEQARPPSLEPEDYYFDGPNLVFTAAYHLKRGSCCGSGCSHCPYGFAAIEADAKPYSDQGADPPTGSAG